MDNRSNQIFESKSFFLESDSQFFHNVPELTFAICIVYLSAY